MLRIAKRTLGGKLLPRFNLRPVRPPGVRFPRAFHFAKRVACARGTHYRQRPRVGQELEGNKRRGNDRRIYDRCQTNAELLLLFPFSPPPPLVRFSFRRFIGWRRIDRLRDPIIINVPSVRLFCLPSMSCLTFSFVCSFVGVEWAREGVGR